MFSQRNELWSPIPLGTYGGHTVGSAGCLMTCCADILTECGVDTDPGRLNRYLARNGGYIRGNLLVFSAICGLADLSVEVIDCARQAAPVDRVRETLAGNGFVIAKVDFHPGGAVQQHWVRILEINEEDAIITDPWLTTPRRYSMMARYGRYDWPGPARAIFRLAFYHNRDGMKKVIGKNVRQESLSIILEE